MTVDSSMWSGYGKTMDPALQALLHHLPPAKSFADYGTAADLRSGIAAQVEQMVAAGIVKPVDWSAAGVEKKNIQIPVRDGSEVRAVVCRPENVSPGPLFIYFHGGGWTFGWPESWEAGFEVLTTQLGITCVGVAYRLAPEHVFPTAAEDACDSLKWCVEHIERLGANPSHGVIVAGSSAGACLAAVASHDAVDRKETRVRGVALMSAGLVHHDAVPVEWRSHYKSWEEHKEALMLDARGMDWFFEQYRPDPKSAYASPLLWPGGHKGQPPTYLQVMGMDPLRDESLIYEHVLREEYGVSTKLDVYSGMPHGAPDFFPMLPIAGKALAELKAGVEWILSQKE